MMADWEWLRDLFREWGPWIEAAKAAFAALGLVFSIIIVPVLTWIGRIRDRNKSLRKQYEAAEAAADEPPEPASAGATIQRWEQIRSKWIDARERAEAKISTLHGNARRKYGEMARYSYQNIAIALQSDRALSPEAAAALRDLDSLALSRRRSRAATQQELERATHLFERIKNELPPANDA